MRVKSAGCGRLTEVRFGLRLDGGEHDDRAERPEADEPGQGQVLQLLVAGGHGPSSVVGLRGGCGQAHGQDGDDQADRHEDVVLGREEPEDVLVDGPVQQEEAEGDRAEDALDHQHEEDLPPEGGQRVPADGSDGGGACHESVHVLLLKFVVLECFHSRTVLQPALCVHTRWCTRLVCNQLRAPPCSFIYLLIWHLWNQLMTQQKMSRILQQLFLFCKYYYQV